LELSYGDPSAGSASNAAGAGQGFHAIFTGDSQVSGMIDAIGDLDYVNSPIDTLQVPHHGSKSGLNEDVVQKLRPSLAIASVGKNRYGHPNKMILSLFEKLHIPLLRTDMRGDIEITVDEKGWRVN
jgi:competence protein ComEC